LGVSGFIKLNTILMAQFRSSKKDWSFSRIIKWRVLIIMKCSLLWLRW